MDRDYIPRITMTNEGQYSDKVVLNEAVTEDFADLAGLKTQVLIRRVNSDLMPTHVEAMPMGDTLALRKLGFYTPKPKKERVDRKVGMNTGSAQATIFLSDQELTKRAREVNNGILNEGSYSYVSSLAVAISLKEVLFQEKRHILELDLLHAIYRGLDITGPLFVLAMGGGAFALSRHFFNEGLSGNLFSYSSSLIAAAMGGGMAVRGALLMMSGRKYIQELEQDPYIGPDGSFNPISPIFRGVLGSDFLAFNSDKLVIARD